MFSGSYDHAIDDKGRLAVPRRWREAMAEREAAADTGRPLELNVTRSMPGEQPHLVALSHGRWALVEQRLEAADAEGVNTGSLRRLFVGQRFTVAIDNQGRILLPSKLREHAGIVKDVLCVATEREKFEIWSPESYAKQEVEDLELASQEWYRQKVQL